MISPKIIDKIFSATFIRRWNDFPRLMELIELDKQAHKFIIAYLIAKSEDDENIDFKALIEIGIFEFFKRVVITDIRPDILHGILNESKKEIDNFAKNELKEILGDVENGEFFKRFLNYLDNNENFKKEKLILKAASHLATKWEFNIIYESSKFLNDIEDVKKSVNKEIQEYYSLKAINDNFYYTKLEKIIDLSGRLRFQKRWAQAPRIPETSVLGHMLIVAILGYFFSLEINAHPKRLEDNFYCALFHDFPEALTRDIISPVKHSTKELEDIINNIEIKLIEEKITPFIPQKFKDEFLYILGIHEDKKDEFEDRTFKDGKISKSSENDEIKIDGKALKNCDRLAAFLEATISVSCGIKSRELVNGKASTFKKIKENKKISGVDFYKLACEIDEFYSF